MRGQSEVLIPVMVLLYLHALNVASQLSGLPICLIYSAISFSRFPTARHSSAGGNSFVDWSSAFMRARHWRPFRASGFVAGDLWLVYKRDRVIVRRVNPITCLATYVETTSIGAMTCTVNRHIGPMAKRHPTAARVRKSGPDKDWHNVSQHQWVSEETRCRLSLFELEDLSAGIHRFDPCSLFRETWWALLRSWYVVYGNYVLLSLFRKPRRMV